MSVLPRTDWRCARMTTESATEISGSSVKGYSAAADGHDSKGPNCRQEVRATRMATCDFYQPKNMTNQKIMRTRNFTRFSPTRFMGVGKPDLMMARDTFMALLYPFGKCWGQDGNPGGLAGINWLGKESGVQEFTSYGNQAVQMVLVEKKQ